MKIDNDILALAERVGKALNATGRRVITVESCTGGWIAEAITTVPGSSAWFSHGYVTYSNEAKTGLVGVPAEIILDHGAVSREVVIAMARGALHVQPANMPPDHLAVAVSGIAGPDGGTEEKPVGTVWLAWAQHADGQVTVRSERHQFTGDRRAIRRAAVVTALTGLLDA